MFLYVMKSGDRVKVGISKAPRKRQHYLTTSNPDGVRLVGFVRVPIAAARAAEKRAHELLSSFRIKGEWFDVGEWHAMTVIEFAAHGSHGLEVVECALKAERETQLFNRRRLDDLGPINALEDQLRAAGWPYADKVFLRL
jgi:hypothetical protein